MESKNIKVIDEHGIDREANIICKFSIDNSDYVLYSISRDEENDNLFASKLLNNNDGTANMVNIEDNFERSKINEIVKDLVTYSLRNKNDNVSSKISLPGGNEVIISDVLFNKEQNINVSKTYITTVKKEVIKVSEDFYKNNKKLEDLVEEQKIETVPVMPEVESVRVDAEPAVDASVVDEPTNEEIMNSFVEEPKEETVVEAPVEPVSEEPISTSEDTKVETQPVVLENETVVSEVKAEAPIETHTSTVEPVLPVVEPLQTETPVVSEAPKVDDIVLPVTNVAPSSDKAEETKTEPAPIIPTVSAIPVMPVQEPVKAVEPVSPVNDSNNIEPAVTEVNKPDTELIFDASKETNLNFALGEVSSDTSVKVDDASSFREFGQDEPVVNTTENVPVMTEAPKVKTLTRSKGFANSKFVTVIAILFFIAACVFLGYEVFHYFQLTK